jgi:hypothetical protein
VQADVDDRHGHRRVVLDREPIGERHPAAHPHRLHRPRDAERIDAAAHDVDRAILDRVADGPTLERLDVEDPDHAAGHRRNEQRQHNGQ